MKTYHKIQTVFKRDDVTHKIIEGAWTLPEFAYLQDLTWRWTEKIDGTNIRVMPRYETRFGEPSDKVIIKIGGKTDNANTPQKLLEAVQAAFDPDLVKKVFNLGPQICLYGEGYGAGIQKGGNYRQDNGFILFDINIDGWWLLRNDVESIAKSLGIDVVPIIDICSINDAIEKVRKGFESKVAEKPGFIAEGLVGVPNVPLFTRKGERIITKIKYKDFL